MIFRAIGVSALLLATQVANADEPTRLLPATPCTLRYDDQACRLVRTFGTAEDAVALTLAQYAPSDSFEIMLSGKNMKARGSLLRYRFVPSDTFEKEDAPLFGVNGEGITTWQFSGHLLAEEEREAADDEIYAAFREKRNAMVRERGAAIEAFEIKSGMERSFTLATGKLDKTLAALDTCMDDLVATWGFDPVLQKSLSRRPKPRTNPGNWISSNDYPDGPLRNEKSGVVRFRLDIDAAGRPTACVVQAAFSDPNFEQATCEILMRKARFEPAQDASGMNVPSYWVSSVKWVI